MTLSLAAIQMSMSDSRIDNVSKAERLVRQAASAGARIILIPELFENEYFCKEHDAVHHQRAMSIDENPTISQFQKVAAELNVVLPLSVYERAGNALFNTVVMVDADGSRMGVYRKSHIPDGPGYQEKYYFRPGNDGFKVWDLFGHKITHEGRLKAIEERLLDSVREPVGERRPPTKSETRDEAPAKTPTKAAKNAAAAE